MVQEVYWCGPIGSKDDFDRTIGDVFVDGRTRHGPWAIMSLDSWKIESGTMGCLGLGLGQMYRQQSDGRWKKVEG
jgi:hypothetical protein